jgi:tellurite methyltransferase
MSEAERDKWDARYAAGAYRDRTHATSLLTDWAERIRPGRALDVACGAGRNSLYLASRGFSVDAADISKVALDRARASSKAIGTPAINWLEVDLYFAKKLLPTGPYQLIVLVRYVDMSLYPKLIERLAPGGLLLSEQHLSCDQDVVGPKNAAFRLAPEELREATRALRLHHYFEGLIVDPDDRLASLAQVVAER